MIDTTRHRVTIITIPDTDIGNDKRDQRDNDMRERPLTLAAQRPPLDETPLDTGERAIARDTPIAAFTPFPAEMISHLAHAHYPASG